MTLDHAALRSFSAALLELAELARTAPPDRLMNDALVALRPLIPFRSAWWGESSDSAAEGPRRNWLHGRINLGESFAHEWNDLATRDVFAGESMQQLGKVVRASGYDEPDPALAAFSKRHLLHHAMAISLELPGSGMLFFIALYRDAAGPAFGDNESVFFSEFAVHLLHHWRARVRDLLLSSSVRASESFALASRDGALLYLGSRLGRQLHKHYADWSGSKLPADLAAMLPNAPCAVASPERLTLEPCGELVLLALDRGGRAATLPPRERSAAMLYSHGRSYKEIARLLNLSPATVRTYLRSVYLHLGVRNKVELSGALGAGRKRG